MESVSAEHWFVAAGDAGTAEYSLDDLVLAIQAGLVSTHSLVWRQGMGDWLELDQVPLLRMMAEASFAKLAAQAPTQAEMPLQGCAESIASVEALEEVECTVVQTRPDLPDKADWIVEPKKTPPATTAQSLSSISELAKRVGEPRVMAAVSIPGTLLARPTLTRPVTAKPELATSLPRREAAPAAIQVAAPVLSIAAPVTSIEITSESRPAPVSPGTILPCDTGTNLRRSEKAPPKPRRESQAPQPTPAVSRIISESSAVAARPVVTARRPTAPVRAPLPTVIVRPTTSPNVQDVGCANSSPKEAPQTPAAKPSLVPAKVNDSESKSPVAAPLMPSPEPLRAIATEAITFAPLSPREPIEAADSLYPAVTSLHPETVAWRKSRTPFYVGVTAIAAVAAVVAVVSLASTPHKSRQTTATAAALTSATLTVKIAAKAPELPSPAAAATDLPLASATDSVVEPSAQTANKSSKRAANSTTAGYPSVDATPPAKKQPRNDDFSVANRQVSEPKNPVADVSGLSKPGTSSPAKAGGNSSSVATWDQGTVERRPWMNPGF